MITVTIDPIIGLIGARGFHVLDHWSHGFSADPIRALYIWQGGLAIWGGVIGGVIGAILFAWRRWRGAMGRRQPVRRSLAQ